MLRGMVFVDHQNFYIAIKNYYGYKSLPTPRLNYNILFRNMTKLVDNVDFVKAYMYIPKPDSFLMQDKALSKAYEWSSGMNSKPFIDVIEGRYIARPSDPTVPMDINDKKTFYKVEKGTDINLTIDAISMAFHNSFDVAFIVSGDTDYLRLYHMLKNLGKLVVVVTVSGQNISRIIPNVDKVVVLDETYFNDCLMPTTPKSTFTSISSDNLISPMEENTPAEIL